MKRTALSCVVFLALVIAAGEVAPGVAAATKVLRPIDAVFDGTFTFEQWGGGAWDFRTIGDARGTLRHLELKLAKLYTSHQPNADGTLTKGQFRIVASNGDEIRGRYSEGVVTTVATVGTTYYYSGEAIFVITGGTGRFANATGTMFATFLETLNGVTWDCSVAWALQGSVRY